MIRNVVVHISNEQPLVADLYELPNATDAGLLCVNLRALDGKRPVFIDRIEDTFFFPYHVIRFLEVPTGSLQRHFAETGAQPGAGLQHDLLRLDEDAYTALPVPADAGPGDGDGALDMGDEIDEDFLRRIREV